MIDGYRISDRGCHINWTLQVVSLGPPTVAPTESAPEGDPPIAADADPGVRSDGLAAAAAAALEDTPEALPVVFK